MSRSLFSVVNMDSYKGYSKTGVYFSDTAVTMGSFYDNGMLIVLGNSDDDAMTTQIFIPWNSGAYKFLYIRTYMNGEWQGWFKINGTSV